jgi:hypothetical protein
MCAVLEFLSIMHQSIFKKMNKPGSIASMACQITTGEVPCLEFDKSLQVLLLIQTAMSAIPICLITPLRTSPCGCLIAKLHVVSDPKDDKS